MNEELIERIDNWLGSYTLGETNAFDGYRTINDCRAEIEHLSSELNKVTWLSMQEVKRLKSELAKAKEYVPMTNYEHYSLWSKIYNATMEQKNWDNNATWNNERVLEAEITKRAGLRIKGEE